MRTSIFLIACVATVVGYAQADTLPDHYARTITERELKGHLEILASDSFLGRDTGKEGQKKAAAYLRSRFMEMGIPAVPAPYSETIIDGYYQPYELLEERAGSISLEYGGRSKGLKDGLLYFSEVLDEDQAVRELVYVGDGTKLPAGIELAGRVVLMDGRKLAGKDGMFGELRERLEPLRRAGARAIFMMVPSFGAMAEQVHMTGSHLKLAYETKKKTGPGAGQFIMVEDDLAKELVGERVFKKRRRWKSGKALTTDFVLRVSSKETKVIAENVLAYIEGGDKKDEVVVLTAHYDHVGVEDGVVYNGADDDGSGTVALLEIAEAFAKAKEEGHGPRRSVLIMPVSGEEKGLLGSRYYSDHPVFPLELTVADLNIDMIGRVDSAHRTSTPYVYVIGSDRLSSGLHKANEEANGSVGLQLDYTFNAESDPNRFYYRSDHYNFARKGVPSVFYFSGVHEDYHKPGDDVDKIRFDLLRMRSELVFRTAWSLANSEDRIVVDQKK